MKPQLTCYKYKDSSDVLSPNRSVRKAGSIDQTTRLRTGSI